ncbi:MAG: retroviral-like aspartic protease family protein [Thermodesulfobacteriota bacterium]
MKGKDLFPLLFLLVFWVVPCYGEMYKWVDEKGTVHFTDDLSKIPERYRPEAETRKPTKETKETSPQVLKEKPSSGPLTPTPEAGGKEVHLYRRHELLLTEVILNDRVKRYFVVDSGASFTLINRETAKELGLTIDENTPFLPVATVSSIIFAPLVTLRSLKVGNAEAENVDALVYTMASDKEGLLGNTFLNRFKVVLDSANSKMTLFPMQGTPSPDRPGGYSQDYWVGQFRFYHRVIAELKNLKKRYEARGTSSELNQINNAIRYFENQLSEFERRASLAGVPRNWRE